MHLDHAANNLLKPKSKPFPRPWFLCCLAEDISLQDPIYVPANRNEETNVKDLLLGKKRYSSIALLV